MNKITFPLRQNMRRDAVADLHLALEQLSHRIEPAEKEAQRFGQSTRAAVLRLQGDSGMQPTGVVDKATANAINAAVEAVGASKPTAVAAATDFTVSGRVHCTGSAAVGNLTVRIVDKTVGTGVDTLLTSATTDAEGRYEATFGKRQLAKIAKQRPDLQARVYASPSAKGCLGASEVRYNAGPRETLDIQLDAKSVDALRSEWTVLTEAVGGHFKGHLRDLKEDDQQQDITYLANKTGWDARAVALAALADKHSAWATQKQASIGPEFFYALFRAGLSSDEKEPDQAPLYLVEVTTVRDIWKRAVEQGVIRASDKEVDSAVDAYRKLSINRLLNGPATVGVSPIKDRLAVSGLRDSKVQQKFGELYVKHRGDWEAFWVEVERAFPNAKPRLKLDSELAYLTLNNAPLIAKLHEPGGTSSLAGTLDLVRRRLYSADEWQKVLEADQGIKVPPEVTGKDDGERRARYAQYLAAQVRLCHPTAVVAEMVDRNLPDDVRDQVKSFLYEHQATFQIGAQSVKQFVAEGKLDVADGVIKAVSRIQRVLQITPDDDSMNHLLKQGPDCDSACAIAALDRDQFVKRYAASEGPGGERIARQVHARAQQVHAAVLGIAVSYITAKTAPGIGAHSDPRFLDARPWVPEKALLTGTPLPPELPAYQTLEDLFGEMDYCECEHCRSVLSPAAYLVDLLRFCDGAKVDADKTALDVLRDRRPDIEHLPLTCDNTNKVLPYIDLVNEALEYFVAQGMEISGYRSGSVDPAVSADELLASPQVASPEVVKQAYDKLRETSFPLPLPFHRWLETLRRYFAKFDAPLTEVMVALRRGDDLERSATPDGGYGWRDILLEELKLSRAGNGRPEEHGDHGLLTEPLRLAVLYGFPAGTSDSAVVEALSNAKVFTRRIGITYEEVAQILKARFINPGAAIVPKLERWGVSSYEILSRYARGDLDDSEFDDLLSPDLQDKERRAIRKWLRAEGNIDLIGGLLVLNHPDPQQRIDECSFDKFEFAYFGTARSVVPSARPPRVRPIEFVRLARFVRLWRKLGWSIEETDKAITALYPSEWIPGPGDSHDDALNKLAKGFQILIPRLGVIKRAMTALKLKRSEDLLPLLACFAEIDAAGPRSLLWQRLLHPTRVGQGGEEEPFVDDVSGLITGNAGYALKLERADVLRGAVLATSAELDEIASHLGIAPTDALTIGQITDVYRHAWLARACRLSVKEFLLLTELMGLDPLGISALDFGSVEAKLPPVLRFLDFLARMRESLLKPEQALYLIWNQDLSGRSAPPDEEITSLARALRSGLAAIDAEYSVVEDPNGDIARARMAQVFGPEATEEFFGLLLKRYPADKLVGRIEAYFERYPDPQLRALFDAFPAEPGSAAAKGWQLLSEGLTSYLMPARKRQQALQEVAASTKADPALAHALLMDASALHATGDTAVPAVAAVADLVAVEAPGLSAICCLGESLDSAAPPLAQLQAVLDYGSEERPLPMARAVGEPVSCLWRGYLEVPENGEYKLQIQADVDAHVLLTLDRKPVDLSATSGIALVAGRLYEIELQVENASGALTVRWERIGGAREVIPGRYLYGRTSIDNLRETHLRFLKAASLASALKLTAAEMSWLATKQALQVGGKGWVNSLRLAGAPAAALPRVLNELLDFATLKAALSPRDERLLAVFKDPVAAVDKGLLFDLTRWERPSLSALLKHFGPAPSYVDDLRSLGDIPKFMRMHRAQVWLRKLGISADALIRATTNEPDLDVVRDLQGALRARYADKDWLEVVKPINDEMRALQRDALVAHILHHFRSSSDPDRQRIDTPDKLFEHFLMDVQMEPCMQTSRIRHALSSVQLFIERCLLGLEEAVPADGFSQGMRDCWAWMKRYRVWEANRKVFLHPENWLEPELRDDQSPFFKEAMSELLQGDITDDRAEQVLLNYVAKLDEVAKLEPCGMYYVPDSGEQVVHVVARTSGARRRYFHRKQEAGLSWTPWEEIKLDIEDNPVIPVVWKGRLFLFWLKILQEAASPDPAGPVPRSVSAVPDDAASTENPPLGEIRLSQLADVASTAADKTTKVRVKALLCWSEHYNGKWQASRTSDVANPTTLRWSRFSPVEQADFDRSQLEVTVVTANDGALIDGPGSSFWMPNPLYLLVSPNASPLPREANWPAGTYWDGYLEPLRSLRQHYGGLDVEYWDPRRLMFPPPKKMLESLRGEVQTTQPCEPSTTPSAPFLLSDAQHVFYLMPITPEPSWDGIGPDEAQPRPDRELPAIVVSPEEGRPLPNLPEPYLETPVAPCLERRAFAELQSLLTRHRHVRRALETPGTVTYGSRDIGLAGSRPKTVLG